MTTIYSPLLRSSWWSILVRGLLAIGLGLLTLTLPGLTLQILLTMFGVYAFLDGVFALAAGAHSIKKGDRWWPYALEAILGIGVGVLTFMRPWLTALALLVVIAARSIILGAFEIGAAIRHRAAVDHQWLLALAGIVSILFGIIILAQPLAGVMAIVWIIGIYALVFGVLETVLGFRARHALTTTMGGRSG